MSLRTISTPPQQRHTILLASVFVLHLVICWTATQHQPTEQRCGESKEKQVYEEGGQRCGGGTASPCVCIEHWRSLVSNYSVSVPSYDILRLVLVRCPRLRNLTLVFFCWWLAGLGFFLLLGRRAVSETGKKGDQR
ncbi:hypothetical protein B0H63DRAFT_160231 [Podospora didyma]|uniref:Transmembrane protein n=1 Tax=Podospora didyma TaxID=330526 RepID=A0AAE0NTR6_9PEZI|nr:hypothetical protein B0H63DRAFT_160231 [Podospora didyma]